MYCIRCGKQLKDGTKYCIYCGAATTDIEPEQNGTEIPDDFTIHIPANFIGSEIEPSPDAIEDTDYTQAVSREQLRQAFQEAQQEEQGAQSAEELHPDGIEDANYTQAVSKEEVRDAFAEEFAKAFGGQEQADDAVSDETRQAELSNKEKWEADDDAEPIRPAIEDIPDIQIPVDFIAPTAPEPIPNLQSAAQPAEQLKSQQTPQPKPRRARRAIDYDEYNTYDDREDTDQIIGGRGIFFVILVVVLLFSIAVGACVLMLRGDMVPVDDTGSAATSEVGFWAAAQNDG